MSAFSFSFAGLFVWWIITESERGPLFILYSVTFSIMMAGAGVGLGVSIWNCLSQLRSRTLDRNSDSYRRGKAQLCHLSDVRKIEIKLFEIRGPSPYWCYCLAVYMSKLGADHVQRMVEFDEFTGLRSRKQARALAEEFAKFAKIHVEERGAEERAKEIFAKFAKIHVEEREID
jgi:hypothetical protein